MLVEVNGARLYVDVENPGLVPDGAGMREKPVLLLLHGGPGFDHTGFKPAFSALTDVAQVVYYDHRGNGRSSGSDPASWNLDQWGEDVKALCDALGVVRPIVCGLSFGGYVAQAYATRYPDHPGGLILMSTAAKVSYPAIFEAFRRRGGPEAEAVARSYWTHPTAESRARYFEHCLPLYRFPAVPNAAFGRAILKTEVALHFNGPDHEQGRLDYRDALSRISCPTLVMAGEEDPIMPIAFGEELMRCLPPHLVRFERIARCGHVLHADAPERVFSTLRDFIAG
ncbi:alpha/beta fold hydrolase [Roseococcus pinisoli]|uniref:Alpha/beta hydrolase n=1 Tax=Roseococcus pinisoli TaxID=2835040 RepID=A0ABS5QJA7_9PROT|nr:alpha/beta hydrolase [Roseococcus pinisoli]MBS7813583.1 alpha/beta hydrolase [Roseococcus pinisoli]